ncbi:hypothetical protein [Gimesia sp.]|uniref:hypothetical protein n=1 Tax=Gimesia sp. TaxID=2024833 RepID=UPI000C6181D5|nr:hypothetical protein [Gimesia sp.]MAX35080.1 hypothetical protein [Gimesia sp.]HAH47043.1 hypothetical protein [Planctomycetaceae bacterium]HBL43857.1 hypothetical protein [Planctomycetaceae bacterium]
MSRLLLLAANTILTLTIGNVQATAADPNTVQKQEDLKQQVATLITQLDDNQRQVREQAESKLIGLGKPVLSLLPPPELATTASVREAIQRVKLQIEKQAARDSLQASRITLKGSYTLKTVLQQISRQSGNQLDLQSLSDDILNRNIQIKFEKSPFWQSIDELKQILPLRYQINGSNDSLQFLQKADSDTSHSSKAPGVHYDGPFRITVLDLKSRPLRGSPDKDLLAVKFHVEVEPRLRPLFLSYAASDIHCSTSQSNKLSAFTPQAKLELPLGEGGKNVNFTTTWILNHNQQKSMFDIQGTLQMELAAETLPITFDNLDQSEGAVRRRGNVSVELVNVEQAKLPSSQSLNVRIALSYDYGGPAFESHRTWIYHNRAYLENSAGQKFWLNGASHTTLESAGKIGVSYQFKELPLQENRLQFTYLAPTLITAAPIKFHFENLKLPADGEKSKP